MGAMTPPSRKSCYNFRVTSIDRVLDGDTIDVTLILVLIYIKKKELELLVLTPPKKEREMMRKSTGN
jgi:hypothetical protein